jgi:hypothetical protein
LLREVGDVHFFGQIGHQLLAKGDVGWVRVHQLVELALNFFPISRPVDRSDQLVGPSGPSFFSRELLGA